MCRLPRAVGSTDRGDDSGRACAEIRGRVEPGRERDDASKSDRAVSERIRKSMTTTDSKVIEGKVKAIIIKQLGVKEEDVSVDKSFVDDLGADSLDIVELVMAMED